MMSNTSGKLLLLSLLAAAAAAAVPTEGANKAHMATAATSTKPAAANQARPLGGDCSGECCDGDGNYLPSGTPCRDRAHPCDRVEKCTGESPDCPEDENAADGAACSWYPTSDPVLGAFMADKSSLESSAVSLQQAASMNAAVATSYYSKGRTPAGSSELTQCLGKCTSGLCTVDFRILHCCMAHEGDGYKSGSYAGSGSKGYGYTAKKKIPNYPQYTEAPGDAPYVQPFTGGSTKQQQKMTVHAAGGFFDEHLKHLNKKDFDDDETQKTYGKQNAICWK